MKLLNIFIFFLLHSIAVAQQFKNNVGAPYIGLSAYSQQQGDVFGYHTNAAALGNIKQNAVGAFAERRFGVQELNNFSLHTALVTKVGGIGLQANRFGFTGFNETQIGLGYGRKLGDKITVGGKANYYQQQIAGYGTASTVNVEAGVLLQLTPKLTSGISAFNPIGGKFGIDKTERLSSIYKLGLGYDVSNKVNLAAEVVKMDNTPLNFIGVIHYQFEKKFFAKVGVSTAASNFFAAAGLSLNDQFRLDVFASHHQQLGFSPGLMLLYSPKSKLNQ